MTTPNDRDTIEVQRRRQGASSGPSGRAEAPARRRGDSGGAGGSGGSGGGGTVFGSSGTGGRGMRLPLWLLIPLVICFLIYSVFFSGNNNSSQSPQDQPTAEANLPAGNEPTSPPPPTRTPVLRKTVTSSTSTNQAKAWTVMLYEDADDQILEEDMYTDLNEMERAGSTDQVNIVAQMDRFKGAFRGDGNWTGARRYYVQRDDDLTAVSSDLLDDLGEINMSDQATLVDFVTWAMRTYPAQHYALILSDHGMGWPGGWSDGDSGGQDPSRLPLPRRVSDNLYTMELGSALQEVQAQTGVKKFDLIGMDACLMSGIEVYAEIAPYAQYAVASEETEPALGWAYTAFLQELTANPAMEGGDVGKAIVQSYIVEDQRIVDDQARAAFLRQGSPMGGLFGSSLPSAAQVASEVGNDVTLTAFNLEGLPALMNSVNDLAVALQDEDQSSVSDAREYAQAFTNIFGKDHSPYIDLGSFAQMLQRKGFSQKVSAAAAQVLAAEKQAVIAEHHGPGKKGATGVSIYFPNSTLYGSPISGAQSYTGIANTFAKQSLWDDFLAFHYNDVPIDPTSTRAIVPGAGTAKRAPGAGQIDISPVILSSKTAAPGKPVTLTAQVQGSNIGYIYLYVGYYDAQANSIMVIDQDYLQSPDTREQGGVYYPVWTEGKPFNLKLKWDPTVFAVSDGQESEAVALVPQIYGASATAATYTLDGTYTYAQDGMARPARLVFRDGKLRSVFGFTSDPASGSAASPAAIVPQPGDTFTIQETWLDLDSSGKVTQTSTQAGKTLTFGKDMFTWQELYAASGDYVIGFIVQDLDGNAVQSYAKVTVK